MDTTPAAPLPAAPAGSARLTYLAFFFVVLFGGSNAVAVRFSNLELPPFWGATLRFGAATLLFWAAVWLKRIPLPRGQLRFYRRGDDGLLEFTGENMIDHTSTDEKIRVYTGNAFDLVGERRRTNFASDSSRHRIDESFEIKLRNHKKEAVMIRVVERLYRWYTWEVTDKSLPYEKLDAQTIEFRVNLPAGEETTITYNVRYTW